MQSRDLRLWTCHLFFTPNPTMKDESEYKERGQQAWSISSAATYSVQRSPIFFDLKLCADPSPKRKSCLNGNAENQFHTHAHTRAHMHAHIRAHKIFWFWLYTPFVQLGFVRFCLFDLSLMSFWMKHNLYQMNKGMWMNFASCLTDWLDKLESPEIPICIL